MRRHRRRLDASGATQLGLVALSALCLWLLFRAAHFSSMAPAPTVLVAVVVAAVASGLVLWAWGQDGGRANYVAVRRWVAGGATPESMSPAQLRTSLHSLEDRLQGRWAYLVALVLWSIGSIDRIRDADGIPDVALVVLPVVFWGGMTTHAMIKARRDLPRISKLIAQTTTTGVLSTPSRAAS